MSWTHKLQEQPVCAKHFKLPDLQDCLECLRYWYVFQANERGKLLDLLKVMRELGYGEEIERAASFMDQEIRNASRNVQGGTSGT